MNADYSRMTHEKFIEILSQIIDESPASSLLSIPNVAELVQEEFNNAVLDRWADENPELAYPQDLKDEG